MSDDPFADMSEEEREEIKQAIAEVLTPEVNDALSQAVDRYDKAMTDYFIALNRAKRRRRITLTMWAVWIVIMIVAAVLIFW